MVDLRFIVISDRQIVSSIKKENVKVKDLGLVVTRHKYITLGCTQQRRCNIMAFVYWSTVYVIFLNN